MKKLMAALGIALCGPATAGQADWVTYQCRYTTHVYGQSRESGEQSNLIETNQKEHRVLFHDNDIGVIEARSGLYFDDKKIFFEVHDGSWAIMKSTGTFAFSAIIRSQKRVGRGKCKVVTD